MNKKTHLLPGLYARAMLSGRKPARGDIPCSTCDMYQARRDRLDFIEAT